MGPGLGPYAGTPVGALGLALFAALGIVLEILVVEEKLLTSGKDEFRTAVDTLEDLIRKFHGRLPRRGNLPKSAIDLGCAGPDSPSSYVVHQQGPGPRSIRAAELGFQRKEDRDDIAPSLDGAK
jgi:hypothetical protein